MRSLFETLGAKVNWDNKNKSVTAVRGETTIYLKINSKQAKVNGKTVQLDVAPKIIDSKTMIPVRFVSEALGAKVNWESAN